MWDLLKCGICVSVHWWKHRVLCGWEGGCFLKADCFLAGCEMEVIDFDVVEGLPSGCATQGVL